MQIAIIDFETYSPISIDAGAMKYASAPDADIIMMGWQINGGPTEMWVPLFNQPFPQEVLEADFITSHGTFDHTIWNTIGRRVYDLPERTLQQWRDSMALGNRYTLPSGLSKLGAVLEIEMAKDTRGKALIRKISCPTKPGQRPIVERDFTRNEFKEYIEYCRRDVDSTAECVQRMPACLLSSSEQRYWELTQTMNLNGLPVDVEAADKILSYIESYVAEMTLRVSELTSGIVQRVTQVAKLKAFLSEYCGIDLPNLTASTVKNTLNDLRVLASSPMHDKAVELLELRQQLGRSSTAKYRKIKLMECHGRVHGNLHYYGAGTGRLAGRGFQLHNLPRASVKDPDSYIDRFLNFEPVDDPVAVAKALIRPMIRAEHGKSLVVSDYKSIENRFLAWIANDKATLENIKNGVDLYADMAAFLYQMSINEVTVNQRQVGKVIILGCGFGMGASRFQATAKDWGIILSDSEAQVAVDAYRTKYNANKKLWYALKDAVIQAIRNPGNTFKAGKCKFKLAKDRTGRVWLVITLPSGRNLFYMSPYLEDGVYGAAPGHYGTDPYTKKWSRLKLIPGRITENICQAGARDIMMQGLDNIDTYMPEVKLIGSVHDEGIGEIHNERINTDTLNRFNQYLCAMPSWADGLPLQAEGYIARRYKK